MIVTAKPLMLIVGAIDVRAIYLNPHDVLIVPVMIETMAEGSETFAVTEAFVGIEAQRVRDFGEQEAGRYIGEVLQGELMTQLAPISFQRVAEAVMDKVKQTKLRDIAGPRASLENLVPMGRA